VLEGQSRADVGNGEPGGRTTADCATDEQPGPGRPVPPAPDSDTRDETEVKRFKAA